MKKVVALTLVATAFAIARFFMPAHPLSPHGSYEAFAHLFVGGLLGAWLVRRERVYLVLAGGLTVVELVAFLIG